MERGGSLCVYVLYLTHVWLVSGGLSGDGDKTPLVDSEQFSYPLYCLKDIDIPIASSYMPVTLCESSITTTPSYHNILL